MEMIRFSRFMIQYLVSYNIIEYMTAYEKFSRRTKPCITKGSLSSKVGINVVNRINIGRLNMKKVSVR